MKINNKILSRLLIISMLLSVMLFQNSVYAESEMILVPNSDIYVTAPYRHPINTYHYMNVDESIADDDSSFVYTSGAGIDKFEIFGVSFSKTDTGAIKKIRVVIRCATNSENPSYARCIIQIGTQRYLSTEFVLNRLWNNYYYDWTMNPVNQRPWLWSDLSNLGIGVSLHSLASSSPGTEATLCTQVYAVVSYDSINDVYPEEEDELPIDGTNETGDSPPPDLETDDEEDGLHFNTPGFELPMLFISLIISFILIRRKRK